MSTAEEIISAIEALPEKEYNKLRRWFSEKGWQAWDAQIESDSKTGKLDFLVKEAQDAKKYGKLGDL